MELPPLLNPECLKPSETNLPDVRYPSDYYRAMAVMGRKEWPTLKNKLSSPDADKVRVALNAYVDAILTYQTAVETHDAFDCRVWPATNDMKVLEKRWDEMNRLRTETRYAMRVKSITRYDLMELLVGKENLCLERPEYSDTDYDDSDEESE